MRSDSQKPGPRSKVPARKGRSGIPAALTKCRRDQDQGSVDLGLFPCRWYRAHVASLTPASEENKQ